MVGPRAIPRARFLWLVGYIVHMYGYKIPCTRWVCIGPNRRSRYNLPPRRGGGGGKPTLVDWGLLGKSQEAVLTEADGANADAD
jgi:hypothetical protein